MNLVTISRTPDEIYVLADEKGRPLGTFFAEDGGWWSGYYANGTGKRLWVPDGGPEEVTRRMIERR
ncbi:hypothetical protein [Actinomadura decatromicini]|uniref:Uncharacterized protein n=1 Tax=Actinomadura decatromicini TaxID=2604572 RepID=A0A5D3FQS0_9ACTN|nr:hypothetical protein [Actinomadura decatromicini]TYK50573.1 hypothetical protein FXF68_08635 [Actinomadura decatromicini]